MTQPQRNFFASAFALAFIAGGAHAQAEASSLDALAMLPVASVAQPAVLAGAGAVFAVRQVQASAYAIAYTLERVSDGARVEVQISGRGVHHDALAVGAVVTTQVMRTGVVLSASRGAVAFVPNTLGQALLRTA